MFVEQCFPAGDAGPKRVEVDLAMDNLVPGRTVYVNAVTIVDEYDVVRIEYQEIPPKEPFPDGLADADDPVWAEWLARNAWPTYPSDDVGTVYDDWGGAEGLTDDGTATDGEFDFHPAPPVAARWLELAFHGSDRPNKDDDARYTLRLNLPLDATSMNQG